MVDVNDSEMISGLSKVCSTSPRELYISMIPPSLRCLCYKPFSRTKINQPKLVQELLTEGEGSVQLISLY